MSKTKMALLDTRTRLMAAASELFRRQGFAGTGMKAIAAASSAPFGSLYHYFPGGKVQLGERVIRENGALYLRMIDEKFAPFDDPADAIEAFFADAASDVEGSRFEDACPIAAIAIEVASTNEDLRVATRHVFESWLAAAASHFHRMGLERGRAEDVAYLVLATIEGAFMLARTGRNSDVIRTTGRLIADGVRGVPRKPQDE